MTFEKRDLIERLIIVLQVEAELHYVEDRTLSVMESAEPVLMNYCKDVLTLINKIWESSGQLTLIIWSLLDTGAELNEDNMARFIKCFDTSKHADDIYEALIKLKEDIQNESVRTD